MTLGLRTAINSILKIIKIVELLKIDEHYPELKHVCNILNSWNLIPFSRDKIEN